MNARAILHPVHSPGLPAALALLDGLDVVQPPDDEGVVDELERGGEILFTFRWDDRFLTPALRWVHAISAGFDQFPVAALAERDVVLTHSRGAHVASVAEHAIALLLALTRGIGVAVRRSGQRDWAPADVGGDEVGDRVLGVLGLGSIGDAIADRAAALGMTVIGTKRDPSGYTGPAAEVLPPGGTLEVFRRSDAVVVALPDTPQTHRIVGDAELRALGPGWLVNVGRGSVVDEQALLRALRGGELRGAGLDVFEDEPLPPDSPLWSRDDVVVTPHSAWATPRLDARLVAVLADNLAAWHGRGPWRNRA